MLKKLQDKKGFTLVELMIVVVIMGILVAVAIPIYNSATKNAKLKSCDANKRVIEENLSAYIMTGNDGGEFTFKDLTDASSTAKGAFKKTTADSSVSGDWPAEFLATFKGKAAPTCPFDKGGYTITFEDQNGNVQYTVACKAAGHPAEKA